MAASSDSLTVGHRIAALLIRFLFSSQPYEIHYEGDENKKAYLNPKRDGKAKGERERRSDRAEGRQIVGDQRRCCWLAAAGAVRSFPIG